MKAFVSPIDLKIESWISRNPPAAEIILERQQRLRPTVNPLVLIDELDEKIERGFWVDCNRCNTCTLPSEKLIKCFVTNQTCQFCSIECIKLSRD